MERGGVTAMSKLYPLSNYPQILDLYVGNGHIFSPGIMRFDYEPTLGQPNGQKVYYFA